MGAKLKDASLRSPAVLGNLGRSTAICCKSDAASSCTSSAPRDFPGRGHTGRTRTLSRRLAAEGTSLQALIEEERKRQGLTLVAANERTISEIADRLGYSNVSNFEQAFRRWTGCSPTQYRRAR